MDNPSVRQLLSAVQRHLWRARFAAAARWALWASTALALIVVPVHLALQAVPLSAVALSVGLLWGLALARAALQRPGDAACALWVDRHLGGASAFTTLLETGAGRMPAAPSAAVRWLEQWAEQRVPQARRLLDGPRPPARLARPLAAMLVCGALAGLVLSVHAPETTVPATPSAAPQDGVGSVAEAAEGLAPVARAASGTDLAQAVAQALRPAAPPPTPARSGPGMPAAGGAAGAQDGAARGAPGPAAPAGFEPGAGSGSATPSAVPGRTQASGSGGGREAGDSRDTRADVGVSPVLPGVLPVQRSTSTGRPSSPDRQADMDHLAAFDPDASAPGGAGRPAGPEPAAATPPPATDATRLTATESSYVQAWMKASGRRP